MKKRLLVLFIAVLALFASLPITSHAEGHDHEGHDHGVEFMTNDSGEETLQASEEINGDMGILYIPCPQGGKHTMYPHGAGELYQNGKVIIDFGYAWQCSKCLEAIVSEYNPKWVKKLGKYGKMNPGFKLTTSYIMKKPTVVSTASSTSVQPWIGSYVWY